MKEYKNLRDPIPIQDSQEFMGRWMQEWDEDPNVWQNPTETTPYARTIAEYWDEKFRQTQTRTVVDQYLELPELQGATPRFRELLESIVMSRFSQVARDRVSPIELDEFEALPLSQQVHQLEKLENLAAIVFEWMLQQNQTPIPGRVSLPMVSTKVKKKYGQAPNQ
ncbi:hypothetical protein [Citricoccus muralis]|uniref:Uncharacterized protein n=1 Tax=Citricoccus muralis TaxID=169134 RepID=A0ABY8HA55_9MICC|nr:hypothetical protein [Citricoccus muralis]WFP17523.1 hypothetical protein P8192_05295 [Citricoccus muralis]